MESIRHPQETALPELALKARRDVPLWAPQQLASVPKEKYLHLKHFLGRRHRSHHGVIAFKDIDRFISGVGDLHLDWAGLFRVGEKQHLAEPHLWSADYWMDPSHKEGLSYVALDKGLLVSRGLYKTALARYALHYRDSDTLYGVKVSRWSVDWEMYQTWLALMQICKKRFPHYRLVPEKKRLSATREGHWMVEEYLLSLRREDRNGGATRIMGRAEAQDWLADLERVEEAKRFSLDGLKAHALAA